MYQPLSKYGIIGNCRSSALVSDEGSIDFACLPNFDSPAYFCSLLDDKVGGFFKIAPTGFYQTNQIYKQSLLPNGSKGSTNILKTYFFNAKGSLSLTDFMPLTKEEEASNAVPEYGLKFVRRVNAIRGNQKMQLELKVTPDFARGKIEIEPSKNYLKIKTDQGLLVLFSPFSNFEVKNNLITLDFELKQEGHSEYFGLGFYEAGTIDSQIPNFNKEKLRDIYKETESFWLWWSSLCKYDGQYHDAVMRSALTLKLLTFNPTGAIIAASTTSLPEKIGGKYNWDYRYTWLRDASFTVYAFLGLGYIKEAKSFINWLESIFLSETESLRIMYRINSINDLTEEDLDHLSGYLNSKPVRVGNGAQMQKQFDIFGEVLTAIQLYVKAGGSLNPSTKDVVKKLVDYCCRHWMEKDAGIWEERDGEKHNTYSKLMCWVGIDKGLYIAKKTKINGDFTHWEKTKKEIKEDILKNGYDPKTQAFTAFYGSKILDSSTFNIPLFGLLPINDPRVISTIEQNMQKLVVDWFVLRSSDEKNELREGEGTFFLSTFWLVDCLTMMGRLDEAKVWLEKIIHDATPLGLYAEEFDPLTKIHLGNFPQAFTHLGLINSVLNLHQAQMLGTKDNWSDPSKRLMQIFQSVNVLEQPLTPFGIRKKLKDLLKEFIP
jgi:alpha,alpha-trehalase